MCPVSRASSHFCEGVAWGCPSSALGTVQLQQRAGFCAELSFEELGTPRTWMRSASVQHPTLKVTGRKAGVWECGRRRSCLVRWEVSGLYGGGSRRLEWDRMHKKVTDNPGKKL